LQIKIYAKVCSAYKYAKFGLVDATPMADSRINDRLINTFTHRLDVF